MKNYLFLTILFTQSAFSADLRSLIFTPKKGEFYGVTEVTERTSSTDLRAGTARYSGKTKTHSLSQYLEYGVTNNVTVSARAAFGESEEKLKDDINGAQETYDYSGVDNIDLSARYVLFRENTGDQFSLNFVGGFTPAIFSSKDATDSTNGTVAGSSHEVSVGVEASKRLESIELFISPVISYFSSGTSEGQDGDFDTDYKSSFSFDLNFAANFLFEEDYSIVTGLSFNHLSSQERNSGNSETIIDPTFGVGLLLAFNYRWTQNMISGVSVSSGKINDFKREVSNMSDDIETKNQTVRNITLNLRYLF